MPDDQLVDSGSIDAQLLVSSQQDYGIRLLGPVLSDNRWQAKAGKGFDLAHFQLDWQVQQATCPQGPSSQRFRQAGERIARRLCPRDVCPLSRAQLLDARP